MFNHSGVYAYATRRSIVKKFQDTHDLLDFEESIEERVRTINSKYEYQVYYRNFDLLVAVFDPSYGVRLKQHSGCLPLLESTNKKAKKETSERNCQYYQTSSIIDEVCMCKIINETDSNPSTSPDKNKLMSLLSLS